jgi:hypothetical protein
MDLYENFKKTLINEMERERDIIVVKNRDNKIETLFGIKSENDRLYMKILEAFEGIAVRNVENLVCGLSEEKGIVCIRSTARGTFDLEMDIEGERQYIEFKSQTNAMNSVSAQMFRRDVENSEKKVNLVFLLKESYDNRRRVDQFAGQYNGDKSGKLTCWLFEDYLRTIFGEEEKKKFQMAMVNYKEEMHKAIGYQITELCSPYHLEKLKQQLDSELVSFHYDAIKQQRLNDMIASGVTANDLNGNNYELIKNAFINNQRYKLLLGNSDFAESYLTSEWLYKKYFALDELDNTFIVAGFLKSIEQLLWDIIYLIGQGREIKHVVISEENQEVIDKTLGSLQYFLSDWSNDDLFQNSFGTGKHYVMGYLKRQISDWRKQYRNGYFHKHNLTDQAKIEAIREETYFLYLLILGTIQLTPAQLAVLS